MRKKKDVAVVKSCGVSPVSAMIVGDRMFSTWRSTNDSHEQSAMPMHGTHICQLVVATVGGSLQKSERSWLVSSCLR